MHTVLLLLSAAATINAWTAPTKAVHKLRVPPRRDEDRCFYGEVGVDGSVVADVAQPRADTIPPKPPSPELSPLVWTRRQRRAFIVSRPGDGVLVGYLRSRPSIECF